MTELSLSGSVVWWVALVVLLANDHLLKGAGLVGGWLTGKLSDFAGLIVATMLAAVLAGRLRATVSARAVAFGAVAATFAATKISPTAAHAVESGLGWLGLRARICVDRTDLLALVVLPVAWRLVARARSRAPGRSARAREAVQVSLGAAACLATSSVEPATTSQAFLTNVTFDTIAVQVFRPTGSLDCAARTGPPGGMLDASLFSPGVCWRIGSQEALPLGDSLRGADGPPACGAAVIRTAGLPDTLLSWGPIGAIVVPSRETIDDLARIPPEVADHLVYLERGGGRLYAAGTALISSEAVVLPAPDVPDCAAATPALSLPDGGGDAARGGG
jgi:hypothetical protein